MKNITYDPDSDVAYIYLSDSPAVEAETIGDGVICDYDEYYQLVGIEILSVTKRTPTEIRNIDIPLNADDKKQLKQLFNLFSLVI